MAASDGNTNKVSSLLKAGTNVNCRDQEGDNTALIWAAYKGHKATAQLLLEHKANIEAKDKFGKTALQHAIDGNKSEVVKVLEAAAAAKKEVTCMCVSVCLCVSVCPCA